MSPEDKRELERLTREMLSRKWWKAVLVEVKKTPFFAALLKAR